MPSDCSWPLIYSIINIKQQGDGPPVLGDQERCRLCGERRESRLRLSARVSCFSLVSVINIPVHILLRMRVPADRHSGVSSTICWSILVTGGLTWPRHRQPYWEGRQKVTASVVLPLSDLVKQASLSSRSIILSPSRGCLLLFPLPFLSLPAGSFIFEKFPYLSVFYKSLKKKKKNPRNRKWHKTQSRPIKKIHISMLE